MPPGFVPEETDSAAAEVNRDSSRELEADFFAIPFSSGRILREHYLPLCLENWEGRSRIIVEEKQKLQTYRRGPCGRKR